MLAEAIKTHDRDARRNFTYRAEPGDSWRSHAEDVRAARKWAGDCDDLASTALDLMGIAGLALEDRYRLVVKSVNGYHMVGCAVDAEGQFWIVGDTFRACYPASLMAHKPVEYNRLSEAGADPVWREGIPWEKA